MPLNPFKKTYHGGWDHYGEPQFDGSSISGGSPVTRGKKKNTKAAKRQSQLVAAVNCGKCNPDKGKYCHKHAVGGKNAKN